MTFDEKIKELNNAYLADTRAPDIAGLVDQLFNVAAEYGGLSCVMDGEVGLCFRVCNEDVRARSSESQPKCRVEHHAAQAVLRMICARLGVICKERTAIDISPYGGQAELEYGSRVDRRWRISFNNTTERQGAQIEALP